MRRLRYLDGDSACTTRSIGVTSCSRGEGVTTIATNLAISAAREGSGPIVLVDANVNSPAVHRHFRVRRSPGFAEVLRGEVEVEAGLADSRFADLSLLTAGTHLASSPLAYGPAALAELLGWLKQAFSYVIVDLPVADELSPCYELAGKLDGVVLVIEADRVRSQVARHAVEKLAESRANVLGVVFNKRKQYVPRWLYQFL